MHIAPERSRKEDIQRNEERDHMENIAKINIIISALYVKTDAIHESESEASAK